MKRLLFILTISMVTIISCSKYSNIDYNLPINTLLSYVEKNSEYFCGYKGHVNISVTNLQKEYTFLGLLRKDCNDSLSITILGPLNRVYGMLTYSNGQLDAISNGQNYTYEIYDLLGKDFFNQLIYSLNIKPITTFSKGVNLNYFSDGYLLDDEGIKVLYSDRFKLLRYIDGEISIEYFWKDNNVSKMILILPKSSVTVKFLNSKGWLKR